MGFKNQLQNIFNSLCVNVRKREANAIIEKNSCFKAEKGFIGKRIWIAENNNSESEFIYR